MNRPENWYAQATTEIFHDQRVQEQLTCDWMKPEIKASILIKQTRECIQNVLNLTVARSGREAKILWYDN